MEDAVKSEMYFTKGGPTYGPTVGYISQLIYAARKASGTKEKISVEEPTANTLSLTNFLDSYFSTVGDFNQPSPSSALLPTPLSEIDRLHILERILLDVKRGGDWEQINTVPAAQKEHLEQGNFMIGTGDIMCAMKAFRQGLSGAFQVSGKDNNQKILAFRGFRSADENLPTLLSIKRNYEIISEPLKVITSTHFSSLNTNVFVPLIEKCESGIEICKGQTSITHQVIALNLIAVRNYTMNAQKIYNGEDLLNTLIQYGNDSNGQVTRKQIIATRINAANDPTTGAAAAATSEVELARQLARQLNEVCNIFKSYWSTDDLNNEDYVKYMIDAFDSIFNDAAVNQLLISYGSYINNLKGMLADLGFTYEKINIFLEGGELDVAYMNIILPQSSKVSDIFLNPITWNTNWKIGNNFGYNANSFNGVETWFNKIIVIIDAVSSIVIPDTINLQTVYLLAKELETVCNNFPSTGTGSQYHKEYVKPIIRATQNFNEPLRTKLRESLIVTLPENIKPPSKRPQRGQNPPTQYELNAIVEAIRNIQTELKTWKDNLQTIYLAVQAYQVPAVQANQVTAVQANQEQEPMSVGG
ncbi:MAG: hypothetical protein HRT73_15005, partial [Flavobacteriales bacterium]|nr:hypothetical protein [Flavobacteriales bacterium]